MVKNRMRNLSTTDRTLTSEEFGKLNKTPSEVAMQVKEHFRLIGITLSDAANRLGCFRQVVYNQLSGASYMSKRAAAAYSREFGFSFDFLRFGHGYMYDDPYLNDIFLGSCPTDYDIAVKIQERERFIRSLRESELDDIVQLYRDVAYRKEKLENENREWKDKYLDISQILVRVIMKHPEIVESVRPPENGEGLIPESEFAEKLYSFLKDNMPSLAR